MAQTFDTIRDKIVSKLQGILDPDTAAAAIAQVQTSPDPNFTGYPAATVYPSNQQSDYQTTAQNERRYVFIVDVFYEHQNKNLGDALNALYQLVDLILDNFDQDPTLTGISLPTGKQMIAVEPTTAEWQQIPDRQILSTPITITVRVSSDIY